jgi:hypothetical protein
VAKPAGRRPGRPQHKPTDFDRGRVSVWAEGGTPQATIARKLHLAIDTLRKHYADELAEGSDAASSDVVVRLYDIAMGKHGAGVRDQLLAQMFWLKCRKGWKDRQAIVHENPDGSPIAFTLTIDHDADDRSAA